MESVKNEEDPRFAHIASDPRFKPMPKSKRKVKIDSRFQSLFTSNKFTQKSDLDKRGRPAFNRLKKSKSTMEQFYEMSSESDNSSDSNIEDKKIGEAEDSEPDSDSEHNNSFKNRCSDRPGFSKSAKQYKIKENTPHALGSSSSSSKLEMEENKKAVQSSPEVTLESAEESEKNDNNDDHDYDDDEDLNGEERESDDEGVELSDEDNNNSDEEDVDLPIFTEEFALDETEVDHKWNELHTDAVVVQDSTSRLAVCNMDWDFVKAQDLFVLFKSFAPENGNVKSVTIYPSEYGKERMANEYRLGPKELKDLGTNDNEDKNSIKKNKAKKKDQKKEKQERMAEGEAATEKLREYQLNRLRYYYAVVDCDSVDTADTIYNELDGHEYQLSSVRLDLRFIPEDMTFDDQPKDKFLENQSTDGYQPGSFESSALCSAKVNITWDETELDRLKKKNLNWSEKEVDSYIESEKLSAFFADSASESEEEKDHPNWLDAEFVPGDSDNENNSNHVESKHTSKKKKKQRENKKIDLYRKLLIDKIKDEEDEKKKEEEDVDMVMQFQPGLKTSAVNKLKKSEKKKEEASVVNEYLEKKRERKKQKKEKKLMNKAAEDDKDAFSDDDIEVDESLKELMQGEFGAIDMKKNKKKKKIQDDNDDEINEKERAELELVLMDGLESKPSISKPEIIGSKKKKKGKKQKAKEKKLAVAAREKEEFNLDVDDKRFGALFTSHHFHIDPTAPQYKRTKNMELLMDEQIKRKGSKKRACEKQTDSEADKDSLVRSIKKKLKKQQ